ncbi:hypothetical protein GCM10022386_03790 [Flavobacterium cheonhonense]|jgi:hypothetical protein|uniref:Uncharacterized protein n=1 Tax=Flavobacterium cheonhonense TaxID=706185 RepID=A0ABP7TCA9_9FLAO|nr:hypothetical protein [Flavobacterium cheonhonense]
MENQDIFNQFKKAAENAESPEFASMEQVWSRVEAKLDQKELKQETTLWKKWAIAASLLLIGTLGYQFLKKDSQVVNSNEIIVQKDSVPQNNSVVNEAITSQETAHPAIKQEADKILEKQIVSAPKVATAETVSMPNHFDSDSISKGFVVPAVAARNHVPQSAAMYDEAKTMEVFIDKDNKVSNAKKEKPLLVYNNKVENKQTVKEVEMDDIESIVELPDPLYIINGVEYTEQELFGPNPTSPYTPLSEQEIDSITVLQQEKAMAAYGQKGKKGVVIISTKNGKPAAKKRQ